MQRPKNNVETTLNLGCQLTSKYQPWFHVETTSILQRWCNVLKTMLKQRCTWVANWRRKINPDSTLKQRPFYNVDATSWEQRWNNVEFRLPIDHVEISTLIPRWNNVNSTTFMQRPKNNVETTLHLGCQLTSKYQPWFHVETTSILQRLCNVLKCWNNVAFGLPIDVEISTLIPRWNNVHSITLMQRLENNVEQRWYLVVDVAMLFQPNIDVETTSYARWDMIKSIY